MHLKVAELLGTVPMCGRGLLRGGWWPVGTKLVFDQMAAPLPEMMDYVYRTILCCVVFFTIVPELLDF
jgi:hypothetical protein